MGLSPSHTTRPDLPGPHPLPPAALHLRLMLPGLQVWRDDQPGVEAQPLWSPLPQHRSQEDKTLFLVPSLESPAVLTTQTPSSTQYTHAVLGV